MAAAVVLLCPSCSFISVHGAAEGGVTSTEKINASRDYVSKSFEIGEFTRIESTLPCDISYSIGGPGLRVYTSDNVIDKLSFDIDEYGTLQIKEKDGYDIRRLNKLKISLTSSTLKGIRIKGAGEVEIKGGLSTDTFAIRIDGSADIDIDSLKADVLEAVIKGAGDIDIDNLDCGTAALVIKGAGDCSLSGKADKVTVDIKGAGDVDLTELECSDITSSVKGAGSVKKAR